MLRIIKWVLLALVVLMLGFIAADRLNPSQQALYLTGVDTTTAGAVPHPDWETLNPFGCRYRFNLTREEFTNLRAQQLIGNNGWEKANTRGELYYPSLNEILTDDAEVYLNLELPNRVRWVVFCPEAELLYLGYFAH